MVLTEKEPDFDKGGGLIPAVVQDATTGEVLMVAYMNPASWRETLRTKKATFWSRSRGSLWVKGETSGHFQIVREIRLDCDADAVLIKVEQMGGAACHTGHRSCFYRRLTDEGWVVDGERCFDPEKVYG
ncbi:MAG TPA: phosphoribosyl-AMP cyclohydrolase [Syntrophales bacterium]|nr:phosphoribosyl-AMP cyclohydrolase [Syntrophales bacterium]HRV42487.1 phosphoribosyl-AMP cyclohydrolase [Syntrophales bacterium]